MPYKDINKKRKFQREWIARNRAEYFDGKVCARCSSNRSLELDHIDMNQKEEHRIWSWKKDRKEVELAKCQVLCHKCHFQKTMKEVHGKDVNNDEAF